MYLVPSNVASGGWPIEIDGATGSKEVPNCGETGGSFLLLSTNIGKGNPREGRGPSAIGMSMFQLA